MKTENPTFTTANDVKLLTDKLFNSNLFTKFTGWFTDQYGHNKSDFGVAWITYQRISEEQKVCEIHEFLTECGELKGDKE